ncbi:MAG TPA: farnesyl diphosphate synthase [Rhizomicrobium sp.]|nr:farnesyl diphosphate synthase [Rhizomicrobium sp.]
MNPDLNGGRTALAHALADTAAFVETSLDTLLPRPAGPEGRVVEAMRYTALGGGKRLRAFLVLETAGVLGLAREEAARVAAAVECVHAYSLIHDDLPAMDDDDLRRGKPTAHRAFDEATAILAGDALLTFAFELTGSPEAHKDAAVRCELITHLAQAAGYAGMIAGQMIDMAVEGRAPGLPEITRLQSLKTGALIAYPCEAGAILAGASSAARDALKSYGRDLGLAFQIADDLLDAEGTAAETGKKVGKDAERGKATFVSVLGIEQSREQARAVADRAAARLDLFGEKAELLRALARFVVERRK